jgi:hypothetical protein
MNPFRRKLLSGSLFMVFSRYASQAISATVPTDTTLHSDLQKVANMRIYFAHQSVGANLIDGLQQLALQQAVPLKTAEFKVAADMPPNTFGHIFVGENGDPLGKLQSFQRALENAPADLHIAMIKFCYVDFSSTTDAKKLFASYQETIGRIKTRSPKLSFVHITAPLTTVQTGPKAIVKRILGRVPGGVLENMRREEYNTLLRTTYSGREPIFDLAKWESTAADGSAVSTDWQESTVPVLNSAYTDDGGHLNALGRTTAAQTLVAVLAKTQWPGSGSVT